MIALIAAVPLETELLRRSLSPCEVRRCYGYDLYRGSNFGRPLCLLHSGVGKASAAAAATALLAACRPAALIMLGCGGAYPGSGLEVGDLALATTEIYGDEGVLTLTGFLDMEAIGLPLAERDGVQLFNRFPVDPQLLDRARPLLTQAAESTGRRLAEGPFVTISTGSGTALAGAQIARRTAGICENMEGAAVAQVCFHQQVPFLELRGISNLVEDRDPARWDLKTGAEAAQRAVQALLAGWNGSKVPA
ncbi:MAG TPA: futalosine hydrolase [Desulfuromonadales bacterium]|jgi:futalosine hydrolase